MALSRESEMNEKHKQQMKDLEAKLKETFERRKTELEATYGDARHHILTQKEGELSDLRTKNDELQKNFDDKCQELNLLRQTVRIVFASECCI